MNSWKHDKEYHELIRKGLVSLNPKNKFPIPGEFEVLEVFNNPENGHRGAVLKRANDIIIASDGTDIESEIWNGVKSFSSKPLKDLSDDKRLLDKKMPNQVYSTLDLYNKYKDKGRVIFAGYSLGGSTSAISSGVTGADSVTFGPYGVKEILDNYNLKYDDKNIVNYVNPADGISSVNAHNHLGDVYEMKSKGLGVGFHDHYLDKQQPITEQIPLKKEDLNMYDEYLSAKNWVNNVAGDVAGKFGQVAKNVRDFGASTVDNVKTGVQNVGSAIVDNVGNVVKPAVEKFEKAISNQGDGGVLQEGAASVIPQEQNSTAHLLHQKNNEKSPVSGDFAPSNQKGGLFGDLIKEQKSKPLSSINNIGNMWDINTSFGTPTGGAAGVGGFGGSSVLGEIEPINVNVISNNVSSVADNFAARKAQKYDYNNKHFGGIRERDGKKEVFVKDYKRSNGNKIPSHWQAISGDFDPNKRLSELEEPELGHAVGFWMDEDKFWW